MLDMSNDTTIKSEIRSDIYNMSNKTGISWEKQILSALSVDVKLDPLVKMSFLPY